MSKRELELMIKLQNQGKDALQNIQTIYPPSQQNINNKIVRENDNIRDILGFNPELLRPQDESENPEVLGLNIQEIRLRAYNFMKRVSSSSSFPFDVSRQPRETALKYYNRIQRLYRNLPKQEAFNAKEKQNELLTMRKHLQEIMSDDDIEVVLNDNPLNDIDNIRIINNTWSSFVKKLKERFKKVDVKGFQNFTISYINDYKSTSGVSGLQPIINVPEPVIIAENDYEDSKAEGSNEFYYVEPAVVEGNPTGILLLFHFTINKRTISIEYDTLKNGGVIVKKENNLTKSLFGKTFKYTEIIRDYLSSKKDADGLISNKTLREQLIELVQTYIAKGLGDSEDNPLSSDDLITDVNTQINTILNTVGEGIRSSSKRRRKSKNKILYGERKAGNTSISNVRNKKYKFLFNKLKSVV